MNTPTPLTDEAWSSAFNAEDFSASSVARSMREFSQQLETELTALRAERDQLRARAELAEAELAAERARLDSGQILLTVAGERVWCSGVDLRAAIDAGIKEGAK